MEQTNDNKKWVSNLSDQELYNVTHAYSHLYDNEILNYANAEVKSRNLIFDKSFETSIKQKSTTTTSNKSMSYTIIFGILGFFFFGLIGFLVRPAVPYVGQLDFNTVISRGSNLAGMDKLMVSVAQSSFNYLVMGALFGAFIGVLTGFLISKAMKDDTSSNVKTPQLKDDLPATKTPSQSSDIADQIRKLSELKDEGILTEEEFQVKKTALLKKE